jgi:3-deoxy-manno-octulosonate cytidylyltransferase (CMP-KDO synthetase)
VGRTAIIIPARLASTRFPKKPLAPLKGADGVSRPALAYTWDAGMAAARRLGPDTLCAVATDDAGIAEYAENAGMNVVMTPMDCRNGTERCAAALAVLGEAFDLVVNLQGDAPLTPAGLVAAVVERLESDPGLAMATVAVPASHAVLGHLQADAAAGRVGGTTVVCNRAGRALYFSKSIIPYVAPGAAPRESVLLHLGLYAYRPDALALYAAREPAPLEEQEGLEQLRFLDAGLPVGVAVCAPPAWEMIELNNPTDVPLIEAQLAARAVAACEAV